MGIADFYPLISENCPEQLVVYHLSELCGIRVAVDISVFLYKYIRSAGPQRWINNFILLMCILKKNGIKAVCIFDGPNPPAEKALEQERRRRELQKAHDRLAECKRIRDVLLEEYVRDDIEPEEDLRKQCKALIGNRKGVDVTNYFNPISIVDSLDEVIRKLEYQTLPITDDYKEMAKKIVGILGLGCFQADGEAETLCAYLAVKGHVDAVLTEDTDVMAYGTPFMLAFKDNKLGDEKVYGLHHASICDALELNTDEFRDLCILLSCDYNDRVKGFPPDGKKRKKAVGIGAKGAILMIQEYRTLEEVCNHVEDDKPLKYRRCRELLTVPDHIPWAIAPYNRPIDYEALDALIKEHKLTISLDYVKSCAKPAKIVFEG